MARYLTDGTIDTTFSSDGRLTFHVGTDSAYSTVEDAQSGILVLGAVDSDFALFRFTSTGGLDTSFATAGMQITDIGSSTADTGRALVIAKSGRILAFGSSETNLALMRYTTAGIADYTFSTDGIQTYTFGTDAGLAMNLANDERILVAVSIGTDFSVERICP